MKCNYFSIFLMFWAPYLLNEYTTNFTSLSMFIPSGLKNEIDKYKMDLDQNQQLELVANSLIFDETKVESINLGNIVSVCNNGHTRTIFKGDSVTVKSMPLDAISYNPDTYEKYIDPLYVDNKLKMKLLDLRYKNGTLPVDCISVEYNDTSVSYLVQGGFFSSFVGEEVEIYSSVLDNKFKVKDMFLNLACGSFSGISVINLPKNTSRHIIINTDIGNKLRCNSILKDDNLYINGFLVKN